MRIITSAVIRWSACALFATALSACGGAPQKVDYSGYYWPPAPEKKRVQLLRMIQTETDIKELSAMDILVGEGGFRSFIKPHDVDYDEVTDTLYVSDTGGNGIVAIDFKNNTIREGLVDSYGFNQPFAIEIDSKNRIIGIVQKTKVALISLDTMVPLLNLGSRGEFRNAFGLAMDPDRKFIYISDSMTSKIFKYSYGGEFIGTVAELGNKDGQVVFPSDMAVDSEGNLYVVDTGNWRIQVFGPDGKFIRKWGSHGSAVGQFGRPKDIAISRDGIVLVTEADFQFVVLFNKAGDIMMAFGGGGSGAGQFVTPSGIAIDSKNRFYVVDQNNRRIQIFQLLTDEEYERSFQTPISGQQPAQPAAPPATGK